MIPDDYTVQDESHTLVVIDPANDRHGFIDVGAGYLYVGTQEPGTVGAIPLDIQRVAQAYLSRREAV